MEKNVIRKGLAGWAAAAAVALVLAGCSASPSTDDGNAAPNESAAVATPPGRFIESEPYSTYLDSELDGFNRIYSATVLYPDGLIETESGSYFPWYPINPLESSNWRNLSVEFGNTLGWEDYVANAISESYRLLSISFDSPYAGVYLPKDELRANVASLLVGIPMTIEIAQALGAGEGPLILTGYGPDAPAGGWLPDLLEDGAPRSLTNEIEQFHYADLRKIGVLSGDGVDPFLNLTFKISISYRVSDEAMLTYLNDIGSANIPMDVLGDGAGVNLFHVNGIYQLGYRPADDGQLTLVYLRNDLQGSTDY